MLGTRSIGLIFVLAAALGAMPAAAQTVGKPNAGVKVPDKTEAATKAFEAGQKAFEAGKTDAAVTALSTAIGSGGVTNAQLAKALFYRGVAYRSQKKPGIALSDLNAAVWLRDGLSATDKAVADDHRQALLREVAAANGTPIAPVTTAALTQAPIAAPPAVETSPPPVVQSTAAPLPEPAVSQPPPALTPPSEQPAALPWTIATAPVHVAPSPVAPDVRAAAAAAHDTITEPVANVAPVDRASIATVQAEPAPPSKPLPWQMAETNAAAPQPEQPSTWAAPAVTATAAPEEAPTKAAAALEPHDPAAIDPPQQPVAALPSTPVDALPALPSAIANAPSALADAGKAAGAALANLFGSAPASAPAADRPLGVAAIEEPLSAVAPIETASIDQGPSISARAATAEVSAAVWSSQTTATSVPASVPVAVAAAPAAAEAPSITVLPGPYRLQIAAANSREAADQILTRLVSQHGQSLRGLQPVVEEPQTGGVLFGSMSAAYRVSIGPYASQIEPGRLCNILKPHDFDCRVVAVAP